IYSTNTEASTTQATTVGIALMFRGQDVTARNAPNALIGEKIDPSVLVTAPAAWLPGPNSYSWSIPGPTFKDYIATTSEGRKIDLQAADLSGSAVRFYWSDASESGVDRIVYVAATIHGVVYQRFTRFRVFEPSAELSVLIGKTGRGRNTVNGPHVKFLLGQGPNSEPDDGGITYTARVIVEAPFLPGEWYLTQLITSWNTALVNGQEYRRRFNGEQNLLDSGVAYNNQAFQTGLERRKIIDSPGNDLISGMSWVQRDDVFHTFLMFVPFGADSRPVPLQTVTVSWGGAVYKNSNPVLPNFGDDWLEDPAHPFYESTDMNGQATTEFPVWPKSADPVLERVSS
ncbi:MAG: hypothetical protein ACREJC_22315, partial [Tepidisphaeraceae bacterium]